jgi:WhiB family transcriptional regulator, redox-sensing transcriptional regulator
MRWADRAECRQHGYDPMWWDGDDDQMTEFAIQICSTCPVQSPCLEMALMFHEQYGIWGGLTPVQRMRIRTRR